MNDPSARRRSERRSGRRPSESSQHTGRPAPCFVLEIALEGSAQLRIWADSHEDEVRLRNWLRRALTRRASLSTEIVRWLDDLDVREAA